MKKMMSLVTTLAVTISAFSVISFPAIAATGIQSNGLNKQTVDFESTYGMHKSIATTTANSFGSDSVINFDSLVSNTNHGYAIAATRMASSTRSGTQYARYFNIYSSELQLNAGEAYNISLDTYIGTIDSSISGYTFFIGMTNKDMSSYDFKNLYNSNSFVEISQLPSTTGEWIRVSKDTIIIPDSWKAGDKIFLWIYTKTDDNVVRDTCRIYFDDFSFTKTEINSNRQYVDFESTYSSHNVASATSTDYDNDAVINFDSLVSNTGHGYALAASRLFSSQVSGNQMSRKFNIHNNEVQFVSGETYSVALDVYVDSWNNNDPNKQWYVGMANSSTYDFKTLYNSGSFVMVAQLPSDTDEWVTVTNATVTVPGSWNSGDKIYFYVYTTGNAPSGGATIYFDNFSFEKIEINRDNQFVDLEGTYSSHNVTSATSTDYDNDAVINFDSLVSNTGHGYALAASRLFSSQVSGAQYSRKFFLYNTEVQLTPGEKYNIDLDVYVDSWNNNDPQKQWYIGMANSDMNSYDFKALYNSGSFVMVAQLPSDTDEWITVTNASVTIPGSWNSGDKIYFYVYTTGNAPSGGATIYFDNFDFKLVKTNRNDQLLNLESTYSSHKCIVNECTKNYDSDSIISFDTAVSNTGHGYALATSRLFSSQVSGQQWSRYFCIYNSELVLEPKEDYRVSMDVYVGAIDSTVSGHEYYIGMANKNMTSQDFKALYESDSFIEIAKLPSETEEWKNISANLISIPSTWNAGDTLYFFVYTNDYAIVDNGRENTHIYFDNFRFTVQKSIQGEGTETNPYILATQRQFEHMIADSGLGKDNQTLYYGLSSNIVFDSSYSPEDIAFKGNFDGNGYEISGLSKALFPNLGDGAVVSNVHLRNCSVSKLALMTTGEATIYGCSTDFVVLGNANADTTVENCYAKTAIISHTDTNISAIASHCYVEGDEINYADFDASIWYYINDGVNNTNPLLRSRGILLTDIDANDIMLNEFNAGHLVIVSKALLGVTGYRAAMIDINFDGEQDLRDLINLKKKLIEQNTDFVADEYKEVELANGNSYTMYANSEFNSSYSLKNWYAMSETDDFYGVTQTSDNCLNAGSYSINEGVLELVSNKTSETTAENARIRTTIPFNTGYLEVKAKFPNCCQYSSLWLQGNNTEVDFIEFGDRKDEVGSSNHITIHGWQSGEHKLMYKLAYIGYDATQWHTYGFERTADTMNYYIDGVLVATTTKQGVIDNASLNDVGNDEWRYNALFTQDIKLTISTLLGDEVPGDTAATLVDYVRFYK